jgi:uncharacterized RDD family membrane protein YckC/energy-coupling factor transporter ATP-binding protein EcfA2
MTNAGQGARVRNPFPGLRPFRSDEEHLFFGRENQVDRMIDKLAAHRFLAVVGTSGSGKSSLVNCGLRPALHRGYMTSAGASWRMAQFRPGSDPIAALATALAEPGVLFDAWDDSGLSAHELVGTTLRLGSLGLVDIVEQARLPEGMQLLVVVDQFEELFRFRAPAGDAAKRAYGPGQDAIAFVKLLLEARAQSKVPIHVVLTMRSDFLGECAQFLGLAEAINDGQYLVPRLNREEIRAAITGPVGVGDATITPVLVTQLLNDVGDNPDQLSILQHALNRTWANWENECKAQGPLDLQHYEAVGGMAGALNRHAERAFGELGSDERKRLAERVFKALTDMGTDPRGIRRPARFAQLCAICGATQDEVESVLEVFRRPSRSFLMPPMGEDLKPESWIDISHESLMRVWKTLADWASAEAESARTYRRLSEAAMLWHEEEMGLLRDPALRLALDWRAKSQPNGAWAAQYQGSFDSTDDFLKQRGETRTAEESESDLSKRWYASRWNNAMAFLDRSGDAQKRENLDAEIDRRWLASWWRYLPIAVVAIVFIVGQISLEGMLTGALTDTVGSLSQGAKNVKDKIGSPRSGAEDKPGPEPGEHGVNGDDLTKSLAKILAHLVSGIPAALGYILLAPYTRKRFREKARTDIERKAAAAANPEAAIEAEAAAAASAIEVHATSYATFGRRACAHVLDWIASVIAYFIVAIAIGSVFLIVELDYLADLFPSLALVLVPWLYHSLSLSSKRRATPGMRMGGIFITDLQGRRLSFLRATARHFASFLSYYIVGIGFLMQPFNKRRQTLHDRICSTVVLRRPPKTGDQPPAR